MKRAVELAKVEAKVLAVHAKDDAKLAKVADAKLVAAQKKKHLQWVTLWKLAWINGCDEGREVFFIGKFIGEFIGFFFTVEFFNMNLK